MTNTSKNSPNVQLLQALGGGVSGALTRFITQPFDVLKIRFQLQVEPLVQSESSKYAGMLHAFKSIYVEEGLRGLWRGHLPAQAMSVTYAIVQFWGYEQLREMAHHAPLLRQHPNLSHFFCGGLAGCLGAIAAQPFDVVRTRVVAADPNSQTSRLRAVTGAFKVFKQDGVRGVSSGMMLSLLQVYPLVGANFVFYKLFNDLVIRFGEYITEKPNTRRIIPTPLLFINGGLAGVISKFLVYPADVVKKRYMLSFFHHDRQSFGENPQCSKVRECVVTTFRNEGVMGFYKGMSPTLYKSGVMTACYFTIYDYFNRAVTLPYKRYENERDEKLKKHVIK
ncbi:hypothetical protein KR222_004110 [Zaprionus bogoriensis]|nr:hypothetical protein KR222_004110 [Zaprionus bogoriensis]